MKVLIAAIVYGLFFILIELASKKFNINKEITRKIVHIMAGTTVAFLPLFMSFHEIVALSLLFIPVMLVSKKGNIFSSIHGVERKTLGEIYFPFAILITALLFPDPYKFAYGLLIMAISDGFASIVGQKYGNHKYKIFSANKSYEGSLTFFITAIIIGFIVLSASGIASAPSIFVSIFAAGVLTAVEGCLSYGLDNLILPPLAAGLVFIIASLLSLS